MNLDTILYNIFHKKKGNPIFLVCKLANDPNITLSLTIHSKTESILCLWKENECLVSHAPIPNHRMYTWLYRYGWIPMMCVILLDKEKHHYMDMNP